MKKITTSLLLVCFVAAGTVQAQSSTNKSKQAKINSAQSAAPASVSENANIMDWPQQEGGEMVMLKEGTNGYTCLPDMPATSGNDPMCLDAPWMTWADAWMNKKDLKISTMGFGYMLQGGSAESNVDPFATAPTPDNEWITDAVPHLMIIVPDASMLKGLPDKPDQGGPWVMWKNTPYVHIMVPMPKHNAGRANM